MLLSTDRMLFIRPTQDAFPLEWLASALYDEAVVIPGPGIHTVELLKNNDVELLQLFRKWGYQVAPTPDGFVRQQPDD